ncbi:hypothetical protein FGL86_11385 [Pistricoccus aurantiacus]|uniref:Uncharacterized protein n=1 Tax=Pistricoccus aurantiacus TaxID=1883414 RepID=A0A5B8SSF5_9GAMM|nr:DUF6482 family protein [Pistricoccus aurantiacus]QEA39616.1 hypothetical protein FGL86_11385 [Pistricoccus aurantiacus]
MSPISPPLPERVTLEDLPRWNDENLIVEVNSLDMGYYIVRLHHRGRLGRLVKDNGETRLFTGTQWISRALLPLGITKGVLTWADVYDEMVGLPTTRTRTPDLEHGTRITFQTR